MAPTDADRTEAYIKSVFGSEDALLAGVMPGAISRGMPAIAVSAATGHVLQALAAAASRPGGIILELGTLAGYSGTWIARALAPGARLITVEPNPLHADIARTNFDRAGLGGRVEIRRTTALSAIAELSRTLGPLSLDMVFIDALKNEYPDYLHAVRPLVRAGGIIVADNAITSRFHVADPPGDPMRDGVDQFNRTIAADPALAASCVPLGSGLVVATRLRE